MNINNILNDIDKIYKRKQTIINLNKLISGMIQSKPDPLWTWKQTEAEFDVVVHIEKINDQPIKKNKYVAKINVNKKLGNKDPLKHIEIIMGDTTVTSGFTIIENNFDALKKYSADQQDDIRIMAIDKFIVYAMINELNISSEFGPFEAASYWMKTGKNPPFIELIFNDQYIMTNKWVLTNIKSWYQYDFLDPSKSDYTIKLNKLFKEMKEANDLYKKDKNAKNFIDHLKEMLNKYSKISGPYNPSKDSDDKAKQILDKLIPQMIKRKILESLVDQSIVNDITKGTINVINWIPGRTFIDGIEKEYSDSIKDFEKISLEITNVSELDGILQNIENKYVIYEKNRESYKNQIDKEDEKFQVRQIYVDSCDSKINEMKVKYTNKINEKKILLEPNTNAKLFGYNKDENFGKWHTDMTIMIIKISNFGTFASLSTHETMCPFGFNVCEIPVRENRTDKTMKSFESKFDNNKTYKEVVDEVINTIFIKAHKHIKFIVWYITNDGNFDVGSTDPLSIEISKYITKRMKEHFPIDK